jgi:hypothetical protein
LGENFAERRTDRATDAFFAFRQLDEMFLGRRVGVDPAVAVAAAFLW